MKCRCEIYSSVCCPERTASEPGMGLSYPTNQRVRSSRTEFEVFRGL